MGVQSDQCCAHFRQLWQGSCWLSRGIFCVWHKSPSVEAGARFSSLHVIHL
uniref:Uncharacterized protein n=1 Tax=Arundo donax TaxID=35708 RepID=A0A0A9H016_ARUDO